MPWVRYVHTGRSQSVKASVSPNGRLGFSSGARQRFGLDDFTHAVLYFDADTRRIGVELTNDPCIEGAVRIRPRKTGADVFCRGFLEYFAITPQSTASYAIERDPDSGWLIIDLSSGRPRKPRSK